jgi:hypothetical protein
MNFSFGNFQVSNAAAGLVNRVNAQIGQTAALDEAAQVDQAPNQPGEVLLDQQESFVQLSYAPDTGSPKDFAFKAHVDLANEQGAVVVPSGTESSYRNAEGKETFTCQVPNGETVARQEAVLDNSAQVVHFSDGTASYEVPYAIFGASSAATELIQKLNLQIAQTDAMDEQEGDQAMGKRGQVLMDDPASLIQLSKDPISGITKSFTYKARQDLTAPDGTVLVAAGTETGYQRDGQLETFRQDVPGADGNKVRRQLVLDNQAQTVDIQDFILKP